MKNAKMQLLACSLTAAVTFSSMGLQSYAATSSVSSVLPSAGIGYALASDQVSLSSLLATSRKTGTDGSVTAGVAQAIVASDKTITETTPLAAKVQDDILNDIEQATGTASSAASASSAVVSGSSSAASSSSSDSSASASSASAEEESFKSLVIAQVDDYVNVRSEASEDSEVLGKLYDKSVGKYLGEENGWYKIESGSVTGYVKAEYCVTGEDAVALAKKVGTRIATVTTTTLKVRSAASTDADVIGLVPIDDELVVSEEEDGWVKVDIEEGEGYVSTDYVTLSTEFVKAESKAEEEARLAKEEAEKEAARKAASSGTSKKSSGKVKSAESYTSKSSSIGSAVASFAQQFVGNPYVYGGTSLTNGTDCSGFVMSVYANFGVSLPHSSSADRSVGAAVDGLSNAQPGDLVCYSGHVALYIGNGQIVHASTSKTGIIVSSASYRTPLSIRRVF
ncbi:MAG: SH3 domain-containing protein [Butyrivibrio sp.]|nr:SH3 domain-containing protein [Butyrivibrio sp.]